MKKKMKKAIIAVQIFCILLALTGCASQDRQKEVTKQKDSVQEAEKPIEVDIGSAEKPIEVDIGSLETKLNDFQEMKGVKYAGDNRVILFADQMYLFDLKNGKVTAQAECFDDLKNEFEMYLVKDGYVIVTGNDENHIICRFYNKNLNKTNEIDLYKDYNLDPIFVDSVAVSENGAKIAAVDFSEGLYLCHVADGQKRQLLDLGDANPKDRQGITAINRIGFFGEQIVFLSQNFELPIKENAQSYTAYGSIGIDGTNLIVEKGNEYGKLQQMPEAVLLSEDIPEKGPAGEAYLYQIEEKGRISFSEKEESQNVFGSDYGNYIITSVNMEHKGWKIRLYQKDGTMAKEEMYACKNTEDYMEPYLFFMEESNVLLLYLRPLGENDQYKIAVLS